MPDVYPAQEGAECPKEESSGYEIDSGRGRIPERGQGEAHDGEGEQNECEHCNTPPLVIVEQGCVMPDAAYRLIRVGSLLTKHGRRMAIVDEADYAALVWRKWSLRRAEAGNYYAATTDKGRTVEMHRLVLGIEDPSVYVDHLDGFGLNNRRYNLLPGTPEANAATRKRWMVERNRMTGLHEVVVYTAAGHKTVVGAFGSYSEAHDERYRKKAYWSAWE